MKLAFHKPPINKKRYKHWKKTGRKSPTKRRREHR